MRRAAVLLVTALVSGCMTFDTRTNPSYTGPPVYSGTRLAAAGFAAGFYAVDLQGMTFFGGDLPLSFVADTLLLPLTVVEQQRWGAERAERARLDVEQPSLIDPARGESAERSARRLFKTCENLAKNLRRLYADCYTLQAKIEIQEAGGAVRTLGGEEYKQEILTAMAPLQGTGEYVRYEDPVFELEEKNVRVRATRIDSQVDRRTPIEFLMGPCEDGGWRILEEKSIGWRTVAAADAQR